MLTSLTSLQAHRSVWLQKRLGVPSFVPSLTINLYNMYSCDGVLQHRTLSSGSLNIEDLEDVVKDQLHGRRESITHISSDKVDKVR